MQLRAASLTLLDLDRSAVGPINVDTADRPPIMRPCLACGIMNGCSTNRAGYLMSLKSGAEGQGFTAYPNGEISRWD